MTTLLSKLNAALVAAVILGCAVVALSRPATVEQRVAVSQSKMTPDTDHYVWPVFSTNNEVDTNVILSMTQRVILSQWFTNDLAFRTIVPYVTTNTLHYTNADYGFLYTTNALPDETKFWTATNILDTLLTYTNALDITTNFIGPYLSTNLNVMTNVVFVQTQLVVTALWFTNGAEVWPFVTTNKVTKTNTDYGFTNAITQAGPNPNTYWHHTNIVDSLVRTTNSIFYLERTRSLFTQVLPRRDRPRTSARIWNVSGTNVVLLCRTTDSIVWDTAPTGEIQTNVMRLVVTNAFSGIVSTNRIWTNLVGVLTTNGVASYLGVPLAPGADYPLPSTGNGLVSSAELFGVIPGNTNATMGTNVILVIEDYDSND